MKLPCRHLLYLLVQQNKNICDATIIADRWIKEYNCSKYQDEATTSDNTSDVQVEVIKHVKASPLKSTKLSRHQKYRQLMLHCQELSDVSSDLPI